MIQDNPNEMQSSLDIWTKIFAITRDVVFIAAIYLYFTGVNYRYSYYDHFGLRNLISDPTPFSAFVLSYGVIASHWMVIAAVALLFVAVLAAARGNAPRLQRRVSGIVAIVTALALFPILNVYASQKADADAYHDEIAASTGKDTRLTLAPGASAKYSQFFLNAAAGYDVHILTRDDKNTYVLWQADPSRGEVYAIPNNAIMYGETVEH